MTASARPAGPPTALIVGGVVLGLSGLIAVASRGAPVWSSLRVGPANRWELLANVALVWGFAAVVAFAGARLVHRRFIATAPGAPPLRTTLQRALPYTAVAFAVLALLTIARSEVRQFERALGRPDLPELPGIPRPFSVIIDDREGLLAGEDRRPEGEAGEREEPIRFDSWLLILVSALAVAIVAFAVRSSYTKRYAWEASADDDEEGVADADLDALHEAVVGTIDSMLADPDPRTAIIGAYARLLEALDACRVGRRPHEAPLEHLRRALGIVHVRPEPLRRLTGLFEIARFSTRPLTAVHRDQALDALRAAAADLAAAASRAETVRPRPIGARP